MNVILLLWYLAQDWNIWIQRKNITFWSILDILDNIKKIVNVEKVPNSYFFSFVVWVYVNQQYLLPEKLVSEKY